METITKVYAHCINEYEFGLLAQVFFRTHYLKREVASPKR